MEKTTKLVVLGFFFLGISTLFALGVNADDCAFKCWSDLECSEGECVSYGCQMCDNITCSQSCLGDQRDFGEVCIEHSQCSSGYCSHIGAVSGFLRACCPEGSEWMPGKKQCVDEYGEILFQGQVYVRRPSESVERELYLPEEDVEEGEIDEEEDEFDPWKEIDGDVGVEESCNHDYNKKILRNPSNKKKWLIFNCKKYKIKNDKILDDVKNRLNERVTKTKDVKQIDKGWFLKNVLGCLWNKENIIDKKTGKKYYVTGCKKHEYQDEHTWNSIGLGRAGDAIELSHKTVKKIKKGRDVPSTIGCKYNNKIMKHPDKNKIWLIYNCKKFYIPNLQILEDVARNLGKKTELNADVEKIQKGKNIKNVLGCLWKKQNIKNRYNNNIFYVTKECVKNKYLDLETWFDKGVKRGDPVYLNKKTVKKIKKGKSIDSSADCFYNGNLIKDVSNNKIYFVNNCKKRWFSSTDTYRYYYDYVPGYNAKLLNVEHSSVKKIKSGNDIPKVKVKLDVSKDWPKLKRISVDSGKLNKKYRMVVENKGNVPVKYIIDFEYRDQGIYFTNGKDKIVPGSWIEIKKGEKHYYGLKVDARGINVNENWDAKVIVHRGDKNNPDRKAKIRAKINYVDTVEEDVSELPEVCVSASVSEDKSVIRSFLGMFIKVAYADEKECYTASCEPLDWAINSYSDSDFKAVYGYTEGEVSAQLESVDFMGNTVSVHRLAKHAFECVVQDIKKCEEGNNYNFYNVGTYNWRKITGGNSLSLHSFGVAVDINPAENPYGSTFKTDIPQCVIDSFERYAFDWGGNWGPPYSYDTMHFEYHGPALEEGDIEYPDVPEEEVPEEEPEEEKDETQQKLEEIEKKFRGLVSLGRSLGLTMAADNLEWYLDGNGGVKEMDSDWLRGFIETRHAIEVNQGRFEESFYERAKQLEDGETLVFREQWDNMYWGIQPKLYLAVGTSTIESHGDFTLVRNGNTVTIEGNVRNNWWDVYDWDPQKSSYYGVSQDDANFLQEHGGAKNFDMKSEWNQIIYGEIEFRWWWIDRQDYWWY